ncbi:MAG: hypothetical protein KGO96_13495 [Elusimicrobia bacterium]|nr:hypothetical protein [Elusimicrobiota bacterium]
MNREAIYAAIYAKATAAAGFVDKGRRLKHIDDLQPSQFPAFYQVQKDENWKQPSGNLPPIGELTIEWWVYAYNSDPTSSTAAVLNPLIDALCASVGLPPAVNPSGYQALGGLVESVRLDGRIDYAEGAMEDRGFARIPLVIRLPG